LVNKSTMKDFFKNNYHKHLGIGFLIGVLTALILHNLSEWQNYMIIIMALFIGYCGGVIWEGEQTYRYNGVQWDWNDVFYSAIGSGIGSLIILFL
jgi:uncharacterized membrane protein